MMKFARSMWVCLVSVVFLLTASAERLRWSEHRAHTWYEQQPWIIGANYIPATAVNQFEMWQTDTFNPNRIDLELGWAQSLGMNTVRVFLHDLLWQIDPKGFRQRIDTFLRTATRHRIRVIFVLFDSCFDPTPHLGKQREPRPGVMMTSWAQSPGAAALEDPAQIPRLRAYVRGVVGTFARDERILAWDLWNEPDNDNADSYSAEEIPDKTEVVAGLLPQVFAWARSAKPSQPLTSGLFQGITSSLAKLDPIEQIQIQESDVISFHAYDKPEGVEGKVRALEAFHRPLICTEYLARTVGSTIQGTLPILKAHHIGALNWGFVSGRIQARYPWDSWKHPYDHEPNPWFHELLRSNGEPYDPNEIDFLRAMTASRRQ